jgi:Arc/MetJ-type ribon-helix-helix transcriptional regulator
MPSCFCYNDGMVRMQVQFTEEQLAQLKKIAKDSDRSISDVVRESVDELITKKRQRYTPEQIEAAMRFAGGGSSGQPGSNIAREHDRYLDEIYGDFLHRR